MPRHVAIVMDGNGRWAQGKGWERTQGHRRGAEAVRTVTTESVALGIARLTLYAFSSENWTRPKLEVEFLMRLLDDFLTGELPTLMKNDVRLEAIGRLDRLPERVRATLDATRAATAGNRAMILCLALSYGGRDEIADACKALAIDVAAGRLRPDQIDADAVQQKLYAGDDVDVVIRTAGEQRLSNFLPWQAIYAEYVSATALWPDFGATEYHAALREFQARERRFGGVANA
ncbi:MAG: di-trans,poly-cis-decaprenylcistransferase [Planctomycetes bacterium]|nr:di-trans,poly-cis-decaprenylcistransferase [Planctomycetota bacterium]